MNRIVVFILVLVIFSGCSVEHQNIKVEETNESYGLRVESGLDKYSLVMSSVPGLPIEIETHGNADVSDIRLLVTCNDGKFISWLDSGDIVELGDEMILPFESTTLYWVPNTDYDNDSEYEQLIVVGTYDKDRGVNSLIYSGVVELDNEGYYSIEFDVRTR